MTERQQTVSPESIVALLPLVKAEDLAAQRQVFYIDRARKTETTYGDAVAFDITIPALPKNDEHEGRRTFILGWNGVRAQYVDFLRDRAHLRIGPCVLDAGEVMRKGESGAWLIREATQLASEPAGEDRPPF